MPRITTATRRPARCNAPPVPWVGSEAGEVGALLYALNQKLGIPLAFAELGMPESGPAEAAKVACASPYYNPRPFEQAPIETLLTRAWKGWAPA